MLSSGGVGGGEEEGEEEEEIAVMNAYLFNFYYLKGALF